MGRGRPREEPTTAVKLHADLVAMAKAVADHRGVPVFEVIEPLFRERLTAMFESELPAMRKAAKVSPAIRTLLENALGAIEEAETVRAEVAARKAAV